jgi:ribosomal protein S18 acetylase RimI-like enzyme
VQPSNTNTATPTQAPLPPAAEITLQIAETPPPAVHLSITADRPAVRIASTADMSFVLSLQRRFSNELGFLPSAAIDWYISHGRVTLSDVNDQDAGYLLGRAALRSQPWTRPLTQTAVCMDAQRRDTGRSLVEQAAVDATAAGQHLLQAWCRIDIPAMAFWRSIGFSAVAIRRPPTTRGHPLILYRRPLTDHGRRLILLLPTAAGYRATADPTMRLLTPADHALLHDTTA